MDSQQQQFCLKWNSFGSNLATSFSNLFKSESLADVTLFCDGHTFKAHKLILAACSKHLADLFATAPLHQNLLVILDGTSAANMSALLEFMYKGEVHVSQDSLSSFLKAAECLQVKGLSIEHEKLAVAQSQQQNHQQGQQVQQSQQPAGQQQQLMETCGMESPPDRKPPKGIKEEVDNMPPTSTHHQSSPSPSYSPVMSPYTMHPHHYRPYEQQQRLPPVSSASYENSMKRPLKSPNEIMQESVRATVLRDAKQPTRPGSPGPVSRIYRPPTSSSNLPSQPGSDDAPETRFDPDPITTPRCPESNTSDNYQDPGCPEDLRFKKEPSQQDESPSSTAGNNVLNSTTGSNGSIHSSNYNQDGGTTARDKEILQASLWNSVTGKLTKTGTINTPDGKKLKCPFCERLYGYETNLRAHIRQRHQGIRVPCPFCSRTFTRNNTVRRHIAREHKMELNQQKVFQQHQQNPQQVHNHNP